MHSSVGIWTTPTQDNSYRSWLVPRAIYTQSNAYTEHLAPGTTRTQDNSYSVQLVTKTTCTQGNSYPGPVVSKSTRTQKGRQLVRVNFILPPLDKSYLETHTYPASLGGQAHWVWVGWPLLALDPSSKLWRKFQIPDSDVRGVIMIRDKVMCLKWQVVNLWPNRDFATLFH